VLVRLPAVYHLTWKHNMDVAACHSHRYELLATAAWRNEGIKWWLLAKNIPFRDDFQKQNYCKWWLECS
jgi:hypothetical protein